MKKITALLMVVIMVAAMIPAMALATSAAATEMKLGVFGSGAETWTGDPVLGTITQFLVSPKDVAMKDICEAIGYVGAHKEKNEETGEETVVPAVAPNGYFKLTITDLGGKKTVVDKLVPNTIYDTKAAAGALSIFRFNTCENGLLIQKGNVYKMQVDVCDKSGKVLYTGTVEGLTWTAGSSEESKHIYQNGKVNDTEYDTSKLYPVKGIEFTRYAGTDEETGMLKSDWEEHESWKHALIVMIPNDKLVSKGDVGAGIQAKIDLGNGKKLTATNNSNYGFDEVTLLRLECNEVPAAGELYHATIELYDETGKTLKYVGTCDVSNGGVKDPEAYELDPKNYPVSSALTPYASGEDVTSHWEVWGGENGTLCLIVVIDNVVNDKDFSIGKVTATFDGKEVKDCLNSVAGLGEGKTVLRLELGKPSEGEHKVSVSVATDDLVLYETDEITVKYNAKGTQTTGGNTPSEKPSDKPSDKTGDGVVVATVAMAIALAAMAVVVKKIKA